MAQMTKIGAFTL